MDQKRLARLRAIFANIRKSKGLRPVRKAALYGGVGAGIYFGGKKIRQKIRERRDERHRERLRSVVRSMQGVPEPEQIEEARKKYAALTKDLSPGAKRRIAENFKLGRKLERQDAKPKSLRSFIKELREESSLLSAYELGERTARDEAEIDTEKRIRALTRSAEAYQEAQKRLHASGTAVPGISGPEESERLAEVASVMLGEDAETKLDKARRWKEKRAEAFRDGRITREQYMKSIDKFTNYRERLLRKQKKVKKNYGLLKDINRPSYRKLRDYQDYLNEDE